MVATNNPSHKVIYLNIGEVAIGQNGPKLLCHGLGSCVAVFIYDRRICLGGGGHFLLPHAPEICDQEVSLLYVDEGIRFILSELRRNGSDLQHLRAKIVGGAAMFTDNSFLTGFNNYHEAQTLIRRNRIFLSRLEVGGKLSRSACFDTTNGRLTVKTITHPYQFTKIL